MLVVEFDKDEIDILCEKLFSAVAGEFTIRITSAKPGRIEGCYSCHDIPTGTSFVMESGAFCSQCLKFYTVKPPCVVLTGNTVSVCSAQCYVEYK